MFSIFLQNKYCKEGACTNGGTCIPNYQNDTAACVCPSTHKGKYCEEPTRDSKYSKWKLIDCVTPVKYFFNMSVI